MVINPLTNGVVKGITNLISGFFYDPTHQADKSINTISRKTRKEIRNEKVKKK